MERAGEPYAGEDLVLTPGILSAVVPAGVAAAAAGLVDCASQSIPGQGVLD